MLSQSNCTCAIDDSFNVRVSDLINPTCPQHGCKLAKCPAKSQGEYKQKLDGVDPEELRKTILETTSRLVWDEEQIAANLLARYDIRRKK